MKALVDQLKQIADDKIRAQAVRVTIAVLNEQLVYESGLSRWERFRHGSSVTALGRAIALLRESFPESDQYLSASVSVKYEAEDETQYGM